MAVSLAIFDLGNVVFGIDWDEPFRVWSALSGVSEADLRVRCTFDHPEFLRFERGEISAQDFHRHFNRMMETSLSFNDFVAGWVAIYYSPGRSDPYPEVERALNVIKDKVKLVAFTNTNAIHDEIWRGKYQHQLENFQRIYVSSRDGFRKPDPVGFQRILSDFRAVPSETVFFDDVEANVLAARKLGIDGVLVNGPESVVAKLALLGLIES